MTDFDPYDALGVERDASPDDVKRAYQRRARETHPDRGGSKEDFQNVSRAYRLLSDPGKRSRFDQTGSDTGPDNTEAMVFNAVGVVLLQILANGGHGDIIQQARSYFVNQREGLLRECANAETNITRYEKAAKRLTRKSKGRNVLSEMIVFESKKLRQRIDATQQQIAHFDRVMQFLKDYEYNVDKQEMMASMLRGPAPGIQFFDVQR